MVYRGPLARLGARPLGFLAPGARRSFSFVAELPTGGRSPAAPSVDPYRGASATVGWTWHSLAGPARRARPRRTGPQAPRPQRPALTFSVPRRQQLLQRRALALSVRCDEDCAPRARATMRSGSRSMALATRRPGPAGPAAATALSVRFSRAQAAALRGAMVARTPDQGAVAVEAYDRSGNRRRDSHVITLRPRR